MAEGDELGERLREAWARFPHVSVDRAAFRRQLVAQIAEGLSLSDLHVTDRYLTFACAEGDEAALEAFCQRYDPVIRHAVSRVAPASMVDDVVAQVRAKLLVGDGARPPAIGSYEGRGKLSTWIQVMARREAHDRLRWDRRHGGAEADADSAFEELVDRAMGGDALLAAMKRAYRQGFAEALRRALSGLSPRERNLLRYECVDGLSRDAIAAIYGVSRATIARWRAQCRETLYAETQRHFSESVAIDPEEFRSVVRMIQSQLHVSLTRMLGAEEDTHSA